MSARPSFPLAAALVAAAALLLSGPTLGSMHLEHPGPGDCLPACCATTGCCVVVCCPPDGGPGNGVVVGLELDPVPCVPLCPVACDPCPPPRLVGFAKFEGIDGESVVAGHEKEIEIEAYSLGGTGGGGRGDDRGRPQLQDATITHRIDGASPKLMEAMLTGKTIPTAKLTIRDPSGVDYITYNFTNVVITGISQGSTGCEPTEVVSFSFAKMEFDVLRRGGSSAGKTEGTGWDVQKGKVF